MEELKIDKEYAIEILKKLISFKKENSLIIKEGRYVDLLPKSRNIFAYKVTSKNGEYLVVSNFSNKELNIDLHTLINDKEVVLSNYIEHVDGKLQPYECLLVK